MENKQHFGSLTARMQAFREEVLDENRILTHSAQYWQHRLIGKI